MELTLDEASQRGIAAQKEDKLQEAERLRFTALQLQPSHPDANHNMGLLAVSVGKPRDSLPFFKLALKASPRIEQFWLSHVNALIAANQLEEARRASIDEIRAGMVTQKPKYLHHSFKEIARKNKKRCREA